MSLFSLLQDEITVYASTEDPEVHSAHSEETEMPHRNLTSAIEATEILLRVVEQKISKYSRYHGMLLSLKNELMHDEGESDTADVTHSMVET